VNIVLGENFLDSGKMAEDAYGVYYFVKKKKVLKRS
jgi:hypothetical protein